MWSFRTPGSCPLASAPSSGGQRACGGQWGERHGQAWKQATSLPHLPAQDQAHGHIQQEARTSHRGWGAQEEKDTGVYGNIAISTTRRGLK